MTTDIRPSVREEDAPEKREAAASEICGCIVVDSCGCYADPCGCYVDPCKAHVDPCGCYAVPCGCVC